MDSCVFFKQKTAYEMRISDWSSDVCSSDLDLGTQTLLQAIDESNADTMFDAAIDQLLKLQSIAPPDDLPAYHDALLARVLRLFDAWFLGRHLGLALDCGALDTLAQTARASCRESVCHSL